MRYIAYNLLSLEQLFGANGTKARKRTAHRTVCIHCSATPAACPYIQERA